MASDRDTLAGLVIEHWSWRDRRDKLQCSCPSAHWVTNEDPAGPGAHGWAEHVADTLIGAGVRPPAHVIYDADDLDELPPGTVVLDSRGSAWQRDSEGCRWVCRDEQRNSDWFAGDYLTVLHQPEEAR